ncbi:MAG: hypothetical protein ACKV0T_10405 [Planctomycetales bacterium]
MTPRITNFVLALAAVWVAGCKLRGDVEVLESELRRQEQTQEELARELQSAREELRVTRAAADSLRAQLADRGQTTLVAEQAEVLHKVQGIKFNTLVTAGVDRDAQPGDEGIAVLLLPVDEQGDLVKLAGAVELELHDLSLSGDDQRLGRWEFSSEEVRQRWHRGFVSSGYLFQLDWQRLPVASELTLHARLTPPDGRQFDATTQLKVAPPQGEAGAVTRSATPAAARTKATPASSQRPAASRPSGNKLRSAPPSAKTPQVTSDNWTEETIPTLR